MHAVKMTHQGAHPNALAQRAQRGATLMALMLLAGCERREASTPPPSRSPTQLCVVRHAEAFKNLSPTPPDMSDAQLDTLTETGAAQARQLGQRLPNGVVLLMTSPAQRAQQTAALLGLKLEARVTPSLRPLEGTMSWEARQAQWARGEDARPAGGGESLADGARRVEALLAEVRQKLGPGEHAVMVTHGDVAALLLGELRGTPLLERTTRDTLATGGMRCLPIQPRIAPHEGPR